MVLPTLYLAHIKVAQPHSASHRGHDELLRPRAAAAAGHPFPSSRSRGALLKPPEARRVPSAPLEEHPSRPRPARGWLCCHGEGFCATGGTKEAALPRARPGCSANHQEKSGTGARLLPALPGGKGQSMDVDRSTAHPSSLLSPSAATTLHPRDTRVWRPCTLGWVTPWPGVAAPATTAANPGS